MWANIGVPSSDVPAEVDSLHMRIERHEIPMEVFLPMEVVQQQARCESHVILNTLEQHF